MELEFDDDMNIQCVFFGESLMNFWSEVLFVYNVFKKVECFVNR